MFIFIMDDGQAYQCSAVTEDDKRSADSGILDIIDTTGDDALQYHDGDWHPLEHWGA